MRTCTALLLVLLSLLAGCTDTSPHMVGRTGAEIVEGTRELGMPNVVFIANSVNVCTGSVISKRVVLTAKHCVGSEESGVFPAESLRVYVGTSTETFTHGYSVREARVIPGRWDATDATDVAVLILTTDAREEPFAVSFDSPSTLDGDDMTAVGYGVTEAGRVGVKYRTEKPIFDVRDRRILVDPSVCPGDSGGPLLGPDGRVWGVASFMYDRSGSPHPVCGEASAAFNTINEYSDLLTDAVEDSGGCLSTGQEVCGNEVDEDCDERVDEDCGEIETSDASCTGGADGGCEAEVPEGSMTAETDSSQEKVGGGACNVHSARPAEGAAWIALVLLGITFRRRRRVSTRISD